METSGTLREISLSSTLNPLKEFVDKPLDTINPVSGLVVIVLIPDIVLSTVNLLLLV